MPIKDEAVLAFYQELISKGGLDEKDKKYLESLLEKEPVSNIFKSGLSTAGILHEKTKELEEARKQLQTEAQTQQTSYQTKLAELDSLRRTLSATSSTNTGKITELENKIRDKEAQIGSVGEFINKIKTELLTYTGGEKFVKEMGLDTYQIPQAGPTPPTPTQQNGTPAFTMQDILAEVQKMFQPNAQALARLPFDLINFQQEYKALSGKDLNPKEFYDKVNTVAAANGGQVDYQQVFLKEYDIENLREKRKVDTIRAELQKEFDEKLSSELNRRMLPQVDPSTGKTSDFFNAIDSTRPKDIPVDNSIPMGISDRAKVIEEAIKDMAQHSSA